METLARMRLAKRLRDLLNVNLSTRDFYKSIGIPVTEPTPQERVVLGRIEVETRAEQAEQVRSKKVLGEERAEHSRRVGMVQEFPKPLPAPTPVQAPPLKTLAQLRREQWNRIKTAREQVARQSHLARQYPGLTGENLARVLEQEYHLAAEKRDTLSYSEAVNLPVRSDCSKGQVFDDARKQWQVDHPKAKFPSRIPRELFFKTLEECEKKNWDEEAESVTPKKKGRPPKAPPKSVIF